MGNELPDPAWRSWHGSLIALANGDTGSVGQRFLREWLPGARLPSEFGRFVAERHSDLDRTKPLGEVRELELPAYSGGHAGVRAIHDLLTPHVGNNLVFACVHGSFGAGDSIPYSDFDGLVVVADSAMQNADQLWAVSRDLVRARQIMYQLDPLQHHGWFVLPEAAVEAWPEDYLPLVTLQRAQALGVTESISLKVHHTLDVYRLRSQLDGMASAILQELEQDRYLQGMYQLKSTLSKIMLLPCLLLQALREIGVEKKDSFAEAAPLFSESEWQAIEVASAVRAAWPEIPCRVPVLRKRVGPVGTAIRKKGSGAVRPEIRNVLGSEFPVQARIFIETMRGQLTAEKSDH